MAEEDVTSLARVVQWGHSQTNIVDSLYEWEAEDIAKAILESDWLAEYVKRSWAAHLDDEQQKFLRQIGWDGFRPDAGDAPPASASPAPGRLYNEAYEAAIYDDGARQAVAHHAGLKAVYDAGRNVVIALACGYAPRHIIFDGNSQAVEDEIKRGSMTLPKEGSEG